MDKEKQDKIFYSISELSKKLNVPQHVLRSWEKEIGFLKPKKKDTGHRIYTEKDLKIAERIKELLEVEHYTIQGARKRLWYELKRNELPPFETLLHRIKKELLEMKEILQSVKEKN